MSLAVKPVHSKRAFVSVPYRLDHSSGRWLPVLPEACPSAAAAAEVPCCVRLSGWRTRKCGPDHPLGIGGCRPHRRWFTLYPPGWTPFARKPLVDQTPRGDAVISESHWCHTLFQALVDAADGRWWPVMARGRPAGSTLPPPGGTRKTQLRHLAGALRLLAVDGADAREQLILALALGVDLTSVATAAARIRDGPSATARAEHGAVVLRKATRSRSRLLSELVDLGRARQFWGPPQATYTSPASEIPAVTFVP
jgi:hypothetical protein